jgi:LPXTG-motif cell wall-anchored protein
MPHYPTCVPPSCTPDMPHYPTCVPGGTEKCVPTPSTPCVKGVELLRRPPTVAGVEQTRAPAQALPNTGASDLTGILSLVGAGLVVAGMTMVGMRRRTQG